MANTIGSFVKHALEELNQSMPEGWELDHTIDFEVTVTTAESTEGRLDIKLFSAGANTKGEAVQKMNFSIIHKARSEAADANQFHAISNGIRAFLKPLQDMDRETIQNIIPPDTGGS